MRDRQTCEREGRIRDYYAATLDQHRRGELLVARENSFDGTAVRADMRTIDRHNVIRLWEFKIRASYDALGQIIVYVSMARRAEGYNRQIRGVIAAFEFQSEIVDAIERMNLGIELVSLPPVLAFAGNVPDGIEKITIPEIPDMSAFIGFDAADDSQAEDQL
ncbi:hypothetical protein N8J89_03640 [Crossiella sp. CA-258035]|uniref:hypothetical protein n=1 Tax=Crossiella sp. CA-258035 TaxID=2981138 RepID=UPI0024BC541D|nr:hypothetical protein [Crossiella sp. CA-258035]WHT20177.1 hypothetical protein N8J89_03640 [Crossiella sp. CA-258035]